MNSTSPANSSISTTAMVGGGGGGGGWGGSSSNTTVIEDFHFPSNLISIQDREEAMLVLKSDLLAALNKEVKSMDEDSWMFEGPRSRINLLSKGGGFLNKQMETTKTTNLAPPK